MDFLYNKWWCCLRGDYIIRNLLKWYLPLTMTLHLLCRSCWPIVCPPYSAFVTSRRDFIIRAVRILLPELTYHWWYTRLPVVQLLRGSSQGFTWYCNKIQGINLVALCYSKYGTILFVIIATLTNMGWCYSIRLSITYARFHRENIKRDSLKILPPKVYR